MVYLGKNVSELDPEKVKRGIAALDHLERRLGQNRFLVGEIFSLADVALVAYTRVAHEGGFDLARYTSIRRWIGETEKNLGLQPIHEQK
jgi:glutathione S-transferase